MAAGWRRALARLREAVRREPAAGRAGAAGSADGTDHETAELSRNYWHAYDERMATVRFSDVGRRFPALIGQAVRLGWAASRRDTGATIALNVASGVFGGYALFATTGVLEALFAAGPTPERAGGAAVADPGGRVHRPPLGRLNRGELGPEPP